MADNVTITEGTGTDIATDDVAGIHYQIVKLAIGSDGSATLVTSSLPVSDAGGSLTVDDGGTALSVDDGGSTLSVDDGAGSLTVDGTVAVSSVSGTIAVTDNDGSLTVDLPYTTTGRAARREDVSTAAGTVAESDGTRLGIIISNPSDYDVWIGHTSAVDTNGAGEGTTLLANLANGAYTVDDKYRGAIYAISANSSAYVIVQEV